MASQDPAHVLLWDILWNDPKPAPGRSQGMRASASIFFGPDVTEDFLHRNSLQLLVRSHQVRIALSAPPPPPQGFFRRIKNQGGGGTPPPKPPPPLPRPK